MADGPQPRHMHDGLHVSAFHHTSIGGLKHLPGDVGRDCSKSCLIWLADDY